MFRRGAANVAVATPRLGRSSAPLGMMTAAQPALGRVLTARGGNVIRNDVGKSLFTKKKVEGCDTVCEGENSCD